MEILFALGVIGFLWFAMGRGGRGEAGSQEDLEPRKHAQEGDVHVPGEGPVEPEWLREAMSGRDVLGGPIMPTVLLGDYMFGDQDSSTNDDDF